MNTLKPCPFCGACATLRDGDGLGPTVDHAGAMWVECDACGASTVLQYGENRAALLAERWNARAWSDAPEIAKAAHDVRMHLEAAAAVSDDKAFRAWAQEQAKRIRDAENGAADAND